MTIVASDTSMLCYLACIGQLALLESLFGREVLPRAVFAECLHPRSPLPLRSWLAPSLPGFIEIAEAENFLPETTALDAGEAAAITIAWKHRPESLPLLDEKRGRAIAQSLGLRIRGILGITVESHRRGFIDFESAILSLRQHGFRLSDSLLAAARLELGLAQS